MDTRDKQLKDELHYTLSRGSVSNDKKIQTILNHVTGELNIGCYEVKGELTSTQPRRRIRQFPNTLPRDKMTYIVQKTFKKSVNCHSTFNISYGNGLHMNTGPYQVKVFSFNVITLSTVWFHLRVGRKYTALIKAVPQSLQYI